MDERQRKGLRTRRDALKVMAGSAGLGLLSRVDAQEPAAPVAGKLKQSIVHWCFARGAGWKLDDTVKAAVELGCGSVEGVQPKDWPLLKEHGLKCAYVTGHGFVKGMNQPVFWDENLKALHERIDACAEYGNPNVLSFTGFADTREQGGGVVDAEQGKRNCIEAFRKLADYAGKKGVTVLLEHLNSRVDEEMKGHPGYQGDRLEYCAEIIRGVDSPHMKLLFDFYHVQIMHGDLIRNLETYRDIIGHVHTAGNPGRGELDGRQEINYRPLMEKLAGLDYEGWVGHEFIPTRDAMQGLREAVEISRV